MGPGAELDMVLLEPCGAVDEKLRARLLAANVFLAERRAMVRAVDFLGDEEDRPVAVDRANRFGGGAACDAASHQQVLHVQVVHTRSPFAVRPAGIIGLSSLGASPFACKHDTIVGAWGLRNYPIGDAVPTVGPFVWR